MLYQRFENMFEHLNPAGNSGIVVALSGGVDSIVLAHLMYKYFSANKNKSKLSFAHFDHQLRGKESLQDADFCRELAEKWGIKFFHGTENVKKYSKVNHLSIEEGARTLRYDFLYKVCHKTASTLTTAHHQDDQIETILMNIERGCGLNGLCGIPRIKKGQTPVIRPMLSFTKKDIESYASSHKLAFKTDSTNTDTTLKRNHYRHILIPALCDEFPDIPNNILKISTTAKRLCTWREPLITEQAKKSLNTTDTQKKIAEYNISSLCEFSGKMLSELIRHITHSFAVSAADKSNNIPPLLKSHTESLIKLVLSGKTGTILNNLPFNITVERDYNILRFKAAEASAIKDDKKINITINSYKDFPLMDNGINITGKIINNKSTVKFGADSSAEYFDLEKIQFPLTLRNVKPGDKISPLGMKGTALVSDIFTNKKIPKGARTSALILSDSKAPLWLFPYVISNKAKLDKDTKKIIEIKITKE
jgi:tRNA(Ile)-lysidine synthase